MVHAGGVRMGRRLRKFAPKRLVDVLGGGALPSFLDTFSDQDGTLLSDHTPDIEPEGAAWSAASSWKINSNQCRQESKDTMLEAWIDGGAADAVLTVTYTTPTASSNFYEGVIFRRQDATHYWLLFYDKSANRWDLYERNPGFTSRASVSDNLGTNQAVAIKITLAGESIVVDLDAGRKSLSYSSSAMQSAAGIGLRSEFYAAPGYYPRWDNLRVQP